jgi:type IVB pilus formation R64 PilN family outer membrane protein
MERMPNSSRSMFDLHRMHLANASSKLTVLALAALMAGCATHQARQAIQEGAETARSKNEEAVQSVVDTIARYRELKAASDEVDRPYLAGDGVPLAPEVTLPPALRAGVSTTILFKSRQKDLMGLAEGITSATGIPVRVKPDALLPLAQFLPRSPQSAGSQTKEGSSLESTTIDISSDDVPLASLLDRVSSRLSVNWRYDGRAIEIYRLDTRTFDMRALPIKTSSAAGMGRNADQKGAFDSSSNTKYQATESDPIASIKAAIESRMTRSGLGPVISPETGTIVVTDTKEVLDGIAVMMERENKRYSRRVDLVFEVTDVTLNDANDIGVDWTAVYRAVTRANGTGNLFRATPAATLAETAAASLGVSIGGTSAAGTSLVVKALSEIGQVVESKRIPIQTINRRPATYAMRSTFNYIDQVTGAGSTAGSAVGAISSGPTLTQKDETVGTVLTVVPDIADDGTVTMSVSYDSTVLAKLDPYSVGSSAQQVTVQQKQIDGSGVVQQVVTRVGVPTVIGGMERQSQKATGRRLDKDAPMLAGGSDSTSDRRTITVLTVTAIARDGI